MSFPSPPPGSEAAEALQRHRQRQDRGVNWHLLVPLAYAPALPIMRIYLTGRVSNPTRDKLLIGTILFALGHAGYVMSQDSTM